MNLNSNIFEKKSFRIASVVVTYNNADNINKLIQNLLLQTYPINEIIVIDNASSDDTVQKINEEFPQVTLFANTANEGVGGAYADGLKYAYNKKYDWVWLLDGDSLPKVKALEELINAFLHISPNQSKIGILASSPVNPFSNEREDGVFWRNRFVKLPKKFKSVQEPFCVDSVISSGSLINYKVVEEIGLPIKEFFMDFVDLEYNLRIRQNDFKIIYVPKSVIIHEIGNTTFRRCLTYLGKKRPYPIHTPWRIYYMVRNETFTYWNDFRSFSVFFFFTIRLGKRIFKLYQHEERWERFKFILLGLRDGFKGRLGKVYGPEDR
ncbi:glycosyltransferase [Candidatus Pacearchaeota archaeon]|nr:glycosyltransferase [Candidatus Pacearchaeota archaeon]